MDTDMLVLKYFDTHALLQSVNNHSVAAVEEPGLSLIYQRTHPDTLFLHSFNTGFLVMNLEKLRENDMLKNIISWLQGHMPSVLYADQDGFDALLADDCTWLDSKFNAIKGTTKNPVIMHYAGTNRKPWLKK
jgi:lipopolysaccharide biosynthesis glycosyltransferase